MTGERDVPAFDGWTIPEGWTPDNIGHCRSCGAEVLWCLTASRRKAPVDRSGTSHFATCPQADSWRKGGTVRGPVTATLGEAGTEAVVPIGWGLDDDPLIARAQDGDR